MTYRLTPQDRDMTILFVVWLTVAVLAILCLSSCATWCGSGSRAHHCAVDNRRILAEMQLEGEAFQAGIHEHIHEIDRRVGVLRAVEGL